MLCVCYLNGNGLLSLNKLRLSNLKKLSFVFFFFFLVPYLRQVFAEHELFHRLTRCLTSSRFTFGSVRQSVLTDTNHLTD